jgi:hypothetical protein
VLAEKNIPDLLESGAKSVDELAVLTKSNSLVLYRMLRRVAMAGFFRELPGETDSLTSHKFENTPTRWTALLFRCCFFISCSVTCFARIGPFLRGGCCSIGCVTCIRRLRATAICCRGRMRIPERGVIFNKAMVSLDGSGGSTPALDFDFSSCSCVVDYAGGV